METVVTNSYTRRMQGFPPEAHWFCPKQNDDDPINYNDPDNDDEDASSATKKQRIEESEQRQECAYRFAISLGLSVEENAEAGGLVDEYLKRLSQLLTTCDKCVRNYHMGRKDFLKYLAE